MSARPHRILVVGAGSIGTRHIRCFLATGRAAVGVCELQEPLREQAAGDYPLEGAYSDLSEALAEGWDAVLVATPAHTHIPIAQQAAEAGCHLLIEKPLSTSLDGVDKLRDYIASEKRIAAVSYNYRAHPGVRAMKSALDSGRYGKPLQLYAIVGQQFTHYRPAYRDIYFADRAQGGGAVQDAMTHILNLAEGLIGPITRIAVDGGHQALKGVEVEDTVHALARHGSVMANYALNLYQHPNESSITLVCEKGTLRFELHKRRWRVVTEPDGPWEDELHPLENRDTWYILNAHAFLDALEGIADPLCTLEEGIQTLRVNLAALQSMDTAAWVALEGGE